MRNPSSTTTTTTTPCCSKVGLKRGPWTPEEDEKLSNYINKDGEGRWRTLPKRAGLLRCGKSCRLRWMNYLRPCVKRGQIASDEEDLILRLHRLLGNRWSLIAGRIPGRTDNEIKNYWNTHLSKKLITQGIDPRTHKPLSHNPNQTNDHEYDPKLSSSTKPQNNVHVPTSPKPNHIPSSSSSGLDDVIINTDDKNNHNNVYFNNNTNLVVDDHAYQTGTNGDEEDDINYCTDDVFSSFLNSLINEDVFVGQPQQGILLPPQDAPSTDDLISSGPAFGFSGTGWDENAIIMSPAFNQIHDPNKF